MMTSQFRMTVAPLLLLVLPPTLIVQLFFVTAYTIIRHDHHVHHHHHQPLVLSQQQQQQQQLPRHSHLSFNTQLQLYNDFHINDGPDNTNGDDDDESDDVCVGGGNDDEEECEIDWSKMPGFDDTESSSSTSSKNNSDNVVALRAQLERQFQMPSSTSPETIMEEAETTPMSSQSSSSSSNMMSDFQRLEMIWQQREESTECDIYEPITCGGQTCATCSGTGHMTCRFCRGTKFLYLPMTHDVLDPDDDQSMSRSMDDFEITQRPPKSQSPTVSKNSSYVSCSICHTSGTEVCRTCKGSGWIAHWTQLGVRVGDILK